MFKILFRKERSECYDSQEDLEPHPYGTNDEDSNYWFPTPPTMHIFR